MAAAPGEDFFAAFPSLPKPYVSLGLPFHEACAHHVDKTFHASRVYIVASKSLGDTPAVRTLEDALGPRVVGVMYGVAPHTPWPDVFALSKDLQDLEPDLIITLGGGSIADGVKLARLFAPNKVSAIKGIDVLRICENQTTSSKPRRGITPAQVPVINVPTTLSGAEFTHTGGGTDPKTGQKRVLAHTSMSADIVVLDPALSVSTPERVWLSTGMRALEYCIEGLYNNRHNKRPEAAGELLQAISTLLVSLLETKRNCGNQEARLAAFLVARESPNAIKNGVGASQGIGHLLGQLGMGHGETSCVMLPRVLKYNWRHGGEALRRKLWPVMDAFWGEPVLADAMWARGLVEKSADPGDLVAAFVLELGLPHSLAQFGIGEDKFPTLGWKCLRDKRVQVNPARLRNSEEIVEILRMAA